MSEPTMGDSHYEAKLSVMQKQNSLIWQIVSDLWPLLLISSKLLLFKKS